MTDERHAKELRPKRLAIHSPGPEAYLHPTDADHLDLHPGDRVGVHAGEAEPVVAAVRVSPDLVEPGEVGTSEELTRQTRSATALRLQPFERARSIPIIRRKLDGQRLSKAEMQLVIGEIAAGRLGTAEVAGWAAAIQVHGLDVDEIVHCIEAMVATGERIQFDREPIVDVHSIGGVPGNKYAPITVAIVAEHGLWIPKTSSRAISSACGTADLMETIAPVSLSGRQIRDAVAKAGGTLAWGGGVNLAPADDAIIRVEYPLALDPPAQIIASVLAKKLAVGATKVLIDLPVGPGAKLRSRDDGTRLAAQFIEVGSRLGLDVQCLLSSGSEPLGSAVGPILEMREVLQVLECKIRPPDIVGKACALAGRLLEMGGAVAAGKGEESARACLGDGRALRRFRAIVAAQGGRADIASEQLVPGKFTADWTAKVDGRVKLVDNPALIQVARAAGSPRDHGAGVLLRRRPGEDVQAGDALLTIHAEHPNRLEEALGLARALNPVQVEGGPLLGFLP